MDETIENEKYGECKKSSDSEKSWEELLDELIEYEKQCEREGKPLFPPAQPSAGPLSDE